ncbi:U32 family peptidase [Desulfobotulus sp.]|jgi:putative protease|uniref:peptidase U32 family protein n=1 Tax=Desulfobotulus sp. TaxID=1940337 RepID=UPI002A36085C|nr:U32 family peptidase [Desulfobotulus sp.]MDY0163604.1 U32 family peptidase [Desulfobotulus sp.]
MPGSENRFHTPIELLAPAGNMEKLEIALLYGADAVYLGGEDFSLRNFSDNFSLKDIEKAIELAHSLKARVYVACNIYPRHPEIPKLTAYLRELAACRPDALIVSDPGVIALAREWAPHIPLHLSTQANTTHPAAARFWSGMGITRVNAARELSLEEITSLCQEGGVEVECFVHGALCIAYSGRCLLSSYMANRDSNRGLCAHPCRWRYTVLEAQRPGHYMPLSEDARGSYIFNSRDLCMIRHIPELAAAGISSLKIEGRMKSIHYLAVTVGVYREALDLYFKDPQKYQEDPSWYPRLDSLHHRGYGTGFYLGDPQGMEPDPENMAGKGPKALFVGNILTPGDKGAHSLICRNRFFTGDTVEVLRPGAPPVMDRILSIHEDGVAINPARPNSRLVVYLEKDHPAQSLLRIPPDTCQKTSLADIVPAN